MDQAITRAAGAMPGTMSPAAATPRLVGPPARSWAVLLTSENHGTVGPVGCTFPWAGEKHERVQVMEIVEAGAPPSPGVDVAGLVRLDIDATNTAGAVPEGSLVPKWAGQFHSYQDWVNKAQSRLASPDHRRAMCVDAKGRRCAIGKDFMLARDEGAFPVRYFWECELAAAPSAPALAEPANFLLPDDMKALARFYECADDFDSGGHDVPKEAMRRLVEIGVVRPAGPGRHMATSFGDHVMGRDAALGLALPLKTLDERNQELALRSNQEKGGADA